jgi:hypothetical protein
MLQCVLQTEHVVLRCFACWKLEPDDETKKEIIGRVLLSCRQSSLRLQGVSMRRKIEFEALADDVEPYVDDPEV